MLHVHLPHTSAYSYYIIRILMCCLFNNIFVILDVSIDIDVSLRLAVVYLQILQ